MSNTSKISNNTNSITENLNRIIEQGTQIGILDTDVTSIKPNYGTRLNTVESTMVTSYDLLNYATQGWVESQGYATTSTADSLQNQISNVNSAVASMNGDVIDHETRLSDVESTYLSTENLQGFVTDETLEAQGFAYQLQVDDIESRLANTETDLDSVTSDYITSLMLSSYATQTWVESQGYATSSLVLLKNYLTVDPITHKVIFSGANVFIQSGSGSTNDDGSITGLGNLIVGYDENTGAQTKLGSHNLIVGGNHSYSSYGGFVAGDTNTISGPYATVTGGKLNSATGDAASVSGGYGNTAGGEQASVGGGYGNTAGGSQASVNGGKDNIANGLYSAISGGDSYSALSPFDLELPYTNMEYLPTYLTVDPTSNTLTFSGANIYVNSGTNATEDTHIGSRKHHHWIR